jgi:hypothetical protein
MRLPSRHPTQIAITVLADAASAATEQTTAAVAAVATSQS